MTSSSSSSQKSMSSNLMVWCSRRSSVHSSACRARVPPIIRSCLNCWPNFRPVRFSIAIISAVRSRPGRKCQRCSG
jgi:hypothetical protein